MTEVLDGRDPWGLCVRISYARDGSTVGVERQQPPTKALIERLGGYVAKTYVRNDTSAFNAKDFHSRMRFTTCGPGSSWA